MKAADLEKEINYKEAKKTVAEYWEKCADCYVLNVDTPPIDVSIDFLNLSEEKYIVRAPEITRIKQYKNMLKTLVTLVLGQPLS